MMKSKSKTKKVFVDIKNDKKQNIPNSKLNQNNMLRRFNSHDIYNTVRGTKIKNNQNSQKNSSNDNKILTINLNLKNSEENNQKQNFNKKNEYGIRYSSNSKDKENLGKNKIKTEYIKSKSNQRFSTNKQIEKINLYINSGRRNQIDSIKILNEESIQELETEDNYNCIDNGNNEMLKTEGNNNPINNNLDNENLYKNFYSEPQKNIKENNINSVLNLNLQFLANAKKNDKDLVLECLSKKGININYQNENGWSALHFACDEGNLKIVEILLKAQIDVNLLTNEKKTAIHFAASRGYFDISKLLIEKKANLNLCDNEKNLPVHLCAMTTHNELLNYLLEQNPQSALSKNLYGKTPYDLAINDENREIIQKFIPGNNNINKSKNSNNNINKNPANNFMKEQCRRIRIHNTNSKQINSLMKTINQNGRKSIPKKGPITTKYSKPKSEKSHNRDNNNNNINSNKYNKKINSNVIMVSTSSNYSSGNNTVANTPYYNTTQGNFNYNSNNNSKIKKQPERVKVVLESPKKISCEMPPQNQLNKTRTKSRYNNNNNINNSNNIHTNKSTSKNLHKDNLNVNLSKNKKNNSSNNNNVNNLSNYNSTNTKKTISIFSSKISATSRKTASGCPDKISSVNNSDHNNIHSNLIINQNNNDANNNLNIKNKELGKHRTISVPRFSNYHLNISNNNNNNNNMNNNNSNNINEKGSLNKFKRQEKRRKSLSDSRKNKIVKKSTNQKLNNFNLIENIEISLEFDNNEKLNSLKKVNSNNNLKITNNISINPQNKNIEKQNINKSSQKTVLNTLNPNNKGKPIISTIINLSEVKNLSNEEDNPTINNNSETNNHSSNDNNISNQLLLNTSKTDLKEVSMSNTSHVSSPSSSSHENGNDIDNENNNENDNNTSSLNNSLSSNSTEEKIGPSSFICIALLGRGSFGEVYLVKHKKTNEKYAMKVLDKNRIAEQNIFKYAMTERNVLSIVHNPFIVKLNYAFQTNEKLFLLLDYCPGGDLAEQLQLQTRFSEEKAKFYLCEVILALGELHKKDIIFRDLKPDNVVIDKEGHAMLTDFGLSREGVYDTKIAKSFCGSIAYLAPEMLSRTGHGKAVDWYLLGVLFYEMLVGIPPYFTNSKEQIFRNIEKADLKIPNFISNKAQKLIKALLKKDPNLRLGSKGDVEEIMKFNYFKDVDWNKVYNRELKPPKNIQDGRQIKLFKEPKLFADDEDDDVPDENNDDNTKFEGWSFVQGNNQKLESNNQCQIHSQSQMNNNRSYNKKK